ncbi:DUF4238 domain-containing protein [Candidatus Kaiserbacteria bacterium]|nr:DUF4238 domain-containing protein [Candidatus Kaiserbacteria bacterium]
MNKQLTRVQHFIPRFILKRFLSSGDINFFDKRYKKFLSKTPKGSMYKEYFYEHDDFSPNEIEDLLASRENIYSPIIDKVLAGEKLTFDDYKILIEFRHITYYRSNEFMGFHTYKKDRGEGSSHQRLEWLRINGIYESKDVEKDIKRSQLKAIQNVISGQDAAYQMSIRTPLCFVLTSADTKFAIGDNGSISMGEEFEGFTVITISPSHAIAFPRTATAIELMKGMGISGQESTVEYQEIDNELVGLINKRVRDHAFEYYVDPNPKV